MTVHDRIEGGPARPIIKLSASEKKLHSGAGWKIARFEGNVLVEFFDPRNTPKNDDVKVMLNEAINDAMFWMSNTDGEHWLVMCAGNELCEPCRITTTDVGAFEKMTRVFSEALR
jgi:hypothetical protein